MVIWVLQSYADLATCRPVGAPIPWTAFAVYAAHKALSAPAADALWRVIVNMDQAERLWRKDQVETEETGGEDGGGLRN